MYPALYRDNLLLGNHFGSLLFLLKIFQLEVSTVLNVIQLELISSLEGGDLHSTETY